MSSLQTSDDKREKLPAEAKFNKWAYGGISYFGQALTGSALTYWIKFSSGRPIYDKMANWLGPNLISKVTSLRGSAAVKGADAFITVSTMVMMGNLFLIPLKWVEDRKASIVEKWTNEDNAKREACGAAISPEEKMHQQELLDELKAAPKQNWLSLGLGRVFSLATVYGTLFALDKGGLNDKMEKAFSGTVKKGVAGVGFKDLAENKTLGNVLNLGFFEGFYSMISAGGLFVYSHFVVPPKDSIVEKPAQSAPVAIEALEQKSVQTHTTNIEHKPRPAKREGSFADNVAAMKNASADMQVAL